MDNLFYNLARRNNPAIRDRSSPQEHSRRASPGTTSAFAPMVRQLITTFMTINRGVLFHRLIPYFLLLCLRVPSSSPSVSRRFGDLHGPGIALPCAQRVAQQFLNFLPDRKSTRLNSSHLGI